MTPRASKPKAAKTKKASGRGKQPEASSPKAVKPRRRGRKSTVQDGLFVAAETPSGTVSSISSGSSDPTPSNLGPSNPISNGANDEEASVVTLLGDIHQPTDLLETAIQQDVEPAPEERVRPETNGTEINGSGTVVRARRSTRENIFEAQVKPLNPIEALLEFFRANPKPQQARDLLKLLPELDIERLGGRRGLENTLEKLVQSGQLVQPKRHTFALPKETAVVVGRFEARGYRFGFLVPETPGLPDLFIPSEGMFYAWHGDRVVARIERKKGEDQPRGRIIRILERSREYAVGTLEYSRGYAILRPDESRLPRTVLLPDGTENLKAGARVNVKLYWPELTGEDEPYGEIVSVLGDGDSPEVETRAVIAKFELRDAFPQAVMADAEKIPLEIPEAALEGRSDLRSRRVFTIDGRDAKDFDDAIHIEPLQNGHFLVGIHVADVSHYVPEGSALDIEARERATSVYLPGKVLPMLPERLSNGVCSLVPDQDRLTVSVLVEISADGEVLNDAIVNSVIHSHARLTYDEVQAFSEGKSAMPENARDLEGDLHLLLKLTTRMRERRFREGSLDFRLREVKVEIQSDGSLALIPVREETARGLIEDLMLTANKVVARHLHAREVPALYRIHEEPSAQRFQEVTQALGKLGVSVPGGKPTPQAYQEMLAGVRGTPLEGPVNTLLLRSMRQAKYSFENKGHFGLAFNDYLHFTSPIRRYPDLIVHRVLKAQLARKMGAKRREALMNTLPALADHTSERERNAAEAERDLTKYYQARWALDHVGQAYKAHVSSVTPFGLFVTLENGVEGLVRFESLTDDQYALVEDGTILRGRTGRQYRLGSPIRIRISGANPVARQIDFVKEMDMNGKNTKGNRPQPQNTPRNSRGPQQAVAGRSPGKPGSGKPGAGKSDGRRVVVLSGRPKGEHSRPVKVTARKLYFGEWSRANMDADSQTETRTQARTETRAEASQPHRERRDHNQPRHQQRPQQQGRNQRPQQHKSQPRAELKPLEPSATERNANRAQRGPAEGRPGEGRANQGRPLAPSGAEPKMRFNPAGAQPAQPVNAAPTEGQSGSSGRRRRRRRR